MSEMIKSSNTRISPILTGTSSNLHKGCASELFASCSENGEVLMALCYAEERKNREFNAYT